MVAAAALLPTTLCAQLPKFEAAMYMGPSFHAVTNGPQASRYDSLDTGLHIGGMVLLRLGDHVALRAGAKRQSHTIRPTTTSTTAGNLTYSGRGVFFTTAAGPILSMYAPGVPKLRLSAFMELARVYDQSEAHCTTATTTVVCPGGDSDDSGRAFGLAGRYQVGDFGVFGEYRRETFNISASGVQLGFHALSIGVMR